MKSNFDRCLTEVLKHEGGFVNDPQDRGGATNLGVTIHTLGDWLKRPATVAEVRALTPRAVAPIYRRLYWDALRCDELPEGLDLQVFDHGVNAGVRRSAKMLQRLSGAVVDGKVGPRTLSAVAQTIEGDNTPARIIRQFGVAREDYYRGLAQFPRYGRGWLRRASEVTKEALQMSLEACNRVR